MAIDQQIIAEDELAEEQQQVIPMEAVSLNTLGTHLLFGEIGTASAYSAINFIIKFNLIYDNGTNLTLMVNSPGGSVSDGFALIVVMETSRLDISTVGIGQVASMGVLVVSAGTKGKRIVTKNTEIMAHQFST